MSVLLFHRIRKRSLPPSSRSRAVRCASFIVPPVSSSFLFFVQTRCRVYHPRSLCVWSLFYTTFFETSNTIYISFILFLSFLFSFIFSFPLARFFLIVCSLKLRLHFRIFFIELELHSLFFFIFLLSFLICISSDAVASRRIHILPFLSSFLI